MKKKFSFDFQVFYNLFFKKAWKTNKSPVISPPETTIVNSLVYFLLIFLSLHVYKTILTNLSSYCIFLVLLYNFSKLLNLFMRMICLIGVFIIWV